MDRATVLWTVVAFFGATVAFNIVQNLTEGEPLAVTLVLQVVVLAVIIGIIVVVVRRQDRS